MAILEPSYMEGTRGTMAVDWESRIDMARMRQERLTRGREAIVNAGYDAVLLLSDPNIRYVAAVATTAVSGAGGFHYTLLCGDGRITHWDSADHAIHERRACPWLQDIRYAAPGIGIVPSALGPGRAAQALTELMADEIARALSDHGIVSGRIGLDGFHPQLMSLLEGHGHTVDAGAGAALAKARAIKTEDEIECLRLSATVCEAGFQAMREAIRPGARESEVFARGVARIVELGGELGGGNISSGPNTWPKSQADTTDRIIRPGDVVYSDLYNIGFHGYRSCYYRTFSCGAPARATRDAHGRAVESLYAVLEAIEPGATTADAAARLPDREGEYWDYYGATAAWQMTTNHWGHGIGLSLYEIPLTWRGSPPEESVVYEAGMTMAVETQDRDGSQGVRVEEMALVRDGGVEVLTRWPIDDITVCA
jgi:Xaa-Pro aminopeptidase